MYNRGTCLKHSLNQRPCYTFFDDLTFQYSTCISFKTIDMIISFFEIMILIKHYHNYDYSYLLYTISLNNRQTPNTHLRYKYIYCTQNTYEESACVHVDTVALICAR